MRFSSNYYLYCFKQVFLDFVIIPHDSSVHLNKRPERTAKAVWLFRAEKLCNIHLIWDFLALGWVCCSFLILHSIRATPSTDRNRKCLYKFKSHNFVLTNNIYISKLNFGEQIVNKRYLAKPTAERHWWTRWSISIILFIV